MTPNQRSVNHNTAYYEQASITSFFGSLPRRIKASWRNRLTARWIVGRYYIIIMGVSIAALVVLSLYPVGAYSQGITFVLDSIEGMPDSLVAHYGEKIRVRISNKRVNIAHETLIFDEDMNNSYSTTQGGVTRTLYANYVDEITRQYDSTTNAVELDSVRRTARICFVTDNDSTDFKGLALGYGIYVISIEYPFMSCDTYVESWASYSWIFDFLDSKFAQEYGVGEDGEMTFTINVCYQEKGGTSCGPANIGIQVMASGRSTPLRLVSYTDLSADYFRDTPIPIREVFEESAPEYEFHLSHDIYRGLDSARIAGMSNTFELTHSAQIDSDIEIYPIKTFSITNTYDGGEFVIERDSVVILLSDACTVAPKGFSCIFNIMGKAGNPIMVRSASETKPTGFTINGYTITTIDHTEMELVQPITVWSDSNASYYGDLKLMRSQIRRIQNQGDGVLCDALRPYAIHVINSKCVMDSCRISPLDSTISRGSGILLDDVKVGSRIRNSTIERFPGHGIEIVDGPKLKMEDNTDPRNTLWLDGNVVRYNRLYGIHIRGSRAIPYISASLVTANGWLGENTPPMQSIKLDAVNIQSAAGIFQMNTFDSSGAYGMHASGNAQVLSSWGTHLQTYGGNCFRWNYYNLGGSANSRIELGTDSSSGINAFTSPRATWSEAFHVTLRGPYCDGYLRGNAWENPVLSTADFYSVSKVDSAMSFEIPEYGGSPILCTQYLSPGGARNDSIINAAQIDEINSAMANGDWHQARDLSVQLLESSNNAYCATFSTTTLIEVLRELGDQSIPSLLSLRARDTLNYHSSVAANYSAIKAFAYIMEYDSSLVLANMLAQRFPYSDHWRMAYIMAAFVQADYLENYYAAEDMLISVLEHYPDDAQAIGAYYSVTGTLPEIFEKRGGKPDERKDEYMGGSAFEVYPNPARKELTVHFSLREDAAVRISLHDINGRFIIDLCEPAFFDAGSHRETLSLDKIRPGYYHVIMRAHEQVHRKFIKIVQ